MPAPILAETCAAKRGRARLLTGLEELNIGYGVWLGAPRPEALGPRTGEAEFRITGGTRITEHGVEQLSKLRILNRRALSGFALSLCDLLPRRRLYDDGGTNA